MTTALFVRPHPKIEIDNSLIKGRLEINSIFYSNELENNLDIELYYDIHTSIADLTFLTDDCEVTLEVQSKHISQDKLEELKAFVTRLSFMDDQVEPELLNRAKEQFGSVNIDLDFSESYSLSRLDRVLLLNPPHLSLYGVEDDKERKQITSLLEEVGYKPYDRYHFIKKERHKCRYLEICNAGGPVIGLGPGSKSLNGGS